MQEAVSQGLSVLDKIQPYAWLAFTLFIILDMVYFHVQIVAGVRSIGSIVRWACGGCMFDPTLESRFDTPVWRDGNKIELVFCSEKLD